MSEIELQTFAERMTMRALRLMDQNPSERLFEQIKSDSLNNGVEPLTEQQFDLIYCESIVTTAKQITEQQILFEMLGYETTGSVTTSVIYELNEEYSLSFDLELDLQ